ncbi:1,2-phenylacetyl-CoA epoxidase subunit PaaC [Streptomyces sp. WMMB 322]|uniref:1,2-phenylacetyl-CoA epoxidase subunit PaaC n=1 Tax=Streptomyces sp. WMMB 322 TaxID=1286821 RepID=UPI000823AF24|nr:1,2-phenylacetyl-CoA epoxidase subunit PaaC [Streptomyces sp. WMMB 322]SCK16188.1 ring-1,2-phenylacetyl-CoA epoxidase subunit PaaC [Streptomyces sp. WMMB 322]
MTGAEGLSARSAAALTDPLLPLADDALVLSHRLGEWAGHAPVLEEELALANIALDLLGQARALYAELGDEDELAFLREERAFRNCQLAEQPNGDFAHTMIRQLYFSAWQELLYGQLAALGQPLAAKAVKESEYHRDHAEHWTLRLGDGTEESHERTQRAADSLWRFTGELFEPWGHFPAKRGEEGAGPVGEVDWEALRTGWTERITSVFQRATLTVPGSPQSWGSPQAHQGRGGAWAAGAGRQGLHTESFGRMLAEMQHLHRSHPGASW